MTAEPFESITIVGAGILGAQLGLHCAVHGYQVWLVDSEDTALDGAHQRQSEELDHRRRNGQLHEAERTAILDRIQMTTALEEATQDTQLVIEAASERLDIKRTIFAQLDALCPESTILATNSSSLRVSAIESATQRADRVLNMHFYNPVWQRPVVELMRGTATSDGTIAATEDFARSIEVTPLLVQKESTGFLFNRVWRAIKKECLHLVDDGVASVEDVDRAWMIAMESPMGPFGRMDRVGLDVVHDIEMVYYRESGDESDAPPKLLLEKLEKGELGVKSGIGFYRYPHPAFQEPGWLQNDSDE